MENQLRDIRYAAERLGMKPQRIRDLCSRYARGEEGGLKSKKIGQHWRIADQDLEEFAKVD